VSTFGQEGVLRPARLRLGSLSAAQSFERAGEILTRDCSLITAWGLITALWLFGGGGFAADSWLTLLGGREVVAHGLPHHDSWAILSHGHQWIDQQWLAQLFYYGFYKLGGLGLVGRINVLLFASAGLIALVAARRRGASPTRVLVCAVPALLLTPSFIRAQVLSELLFVVVLILLVQESRRPSRRAFAVFPLIALWGNLHGAAVMGAAMVSLLGLVELGRAARFTSGRRVGRSLLLAFGAWPCLLATPYAAGVVPYYRATLENPAFAKYITEWQSPHPLTLWGATFFLTALFAAVVVARRICDFNMFELAILLFTFVGGLLAVRSVVWFVYAVLILVPRALERLWPAREEPGGRQFVPLRAALATLPLVLCLVFVARQQTNVEQLWPSGASRSVAKAARKDPSLRIFSNEEYADWLLFREPQLQGRIAFDGRWEILQPDQMSAVVDFLFKRTPEWQHVARGYGLFVLDPKTNRRVDETFSRRVDMLVVYRDKRVVVFERRPSA
jgi:hypothetical protein